MLPMTTPISPYKPSSASIEPVKKSHLLLEQIVDLMREQRDIGHKLLIELEKLNAQLNSEILAELKESTSIARRAAYGPPVEQ